MGKTAFITLIRFKFAKLDGLDIFATMDLDDNIKHSLQKLEKSLDALDNALVKQVNGVAVQDDLTDELNLLSEDRSRLASELDEAVAKIDTLEAVNVEVEQRIDNVMAEISTLLEA